MDRQKRIEIAADYLKKRGWKVEVEPRRGIDIAATMPSGLLVFVAVFDLDGRKKFQDNPFSTSAGGKRFVSLVTSSQWWYRNNGISPKVHCRYDTITVDEFGGLDHVEDAGRKGF